VKVIDEAFIIYEVGLSFASRQNRRKENSSRENNFSDVNQGIRLAGGQLDLSGRLRLLLERQASLATRLLLGSASIGDQTSALVALSAVRGQISDGHQRAAARRMHGHDGLNVSGQLQLRVQLGRVLQQLLSRQVLVGQLQRSGATEQQHANASGELNAKHKNDENEPSQDTTKNRNKNRRVSELKGKML
jgi:hypothetical protein